MGLLEQFLLPFGITQEKPEPVIQADPAPHKKARTVALQGHAIPWLLKRTRRKTVGMSIGAGVIQVNAPRYVPVGDIEMILQEKSRWLLARLAEWQQAERQRILPEQQWAHGASLQYLGRPLTLVIAAEHAGTHWDDFRRELHLALPTDAGTAQIRDMVHAWLQGQARALLGERLRHISAQSGRSYSKFSLSNARGRWGSCTESGHIRLNWRLIHFSEAVIDYVIAHELAHIHTMDHSADFWNEVADILPSFEEGKTVLRKVRLESLPTF